MMKNTKINMQQTNKVLPIILILLLIDSCNINESDGTIITPSAPPKEDLISLIQTKNDTDAYNLFLFYYPDDLAILPLAVYMAENRKYGKAYYDIFHTMYSVFRENSISMDSITQKNMLYYLEKGCELKDTDCVWAMSVLYMTGTFVDRDTIMAKENLMKVFSSDEIDRFYWILLKKNQMTEFAKNHNAHSFSDN